MGLGILRSAPAVGALVAGVILARRPIRGNAGRTLFLVVAIFGASHIVFGLSKSFPLSCAALAVAGFADMFSMNIRSMTVALATPDELRGRVNAVEMVFISGSNELGAFESGIAAALIGAVPAVVLGGVATICIAVIWARLFPDLRDVDRLELLRPATTTGHFARDVPPQRARPVPRRRPHRPWTRGAGHAGVDGSGGQTPASQDRSRFVRGGSGRGARRRLRPPGLVSASRPSPARISGARPWSRFPRRGAASGSSLPPPDVVPALTDKAALAEVPAQCMAFRTPPVFVVWRLGLSMTCNGRIH